MQGRRVGEVDGVCFAHSLLSTKVNLILTGVGLNIVVVLAIFGYLLIHEGKFSSMSTSMLDLSRRVSNLETLRPLMSIKS